jgi:hypothetical protein
MNRHYEPDPRFHAWLAERAPLSAPDDLLQRTMREVDQVSQERGWLTRWPMLRFTTQIGAVAAVIVLAIGVAVLYSMLQPSVGPGESPVPSPSASPVALISGPATCENEIDGFSVAVPDGWYTNDAGLGLPACMLFSPESFALTDPNVLPDVPIILSVLPNGDFGFTFEEIVERSELTIAGLPALRFVTDTAPGRGLTYVIGLDGSLPSEGNEGRLLIARTLAHHDAFDRDSAALDEIIAGFEPIPGPAASCDEWEATASDDVVLLYFPCDGGEPRPVERAVSGTGDARVIETMRLYLAGPSAEERAAGFGSLLSPGDAEVVEVSLGRMVLDFPSEVNNVGTSAGSAAVLDGLRQTFIALGGIEQIELRLRDDCAAFFEWIQVGPTCHLLTADGLVPAPTSSVPAIQVATCEHPSGAYQVVLPEGWWTNPTFEDAEMGVIAACRFFAPSEFDLSSLDRDSVVPEGAAISIDFLDGGCIGYINPILSSRETTVDGFAATVSELAFGKEETNPPHAYEYVVYLTPEVECESGTDLIYAVTTRDLAGDYEENKATLDRMMEAILISNP